MKKLVIVSVISLLVVPSYGCECCKLKQEEKNLANILNHTKQMKEDARLAGVPSFAKRATAEWQKAYDRAVSNFQEASNKRIACEKKLHKKGH